MLQVSELAEVLKAFRFQHNTVAAKETSYLNSTVRSVKIKDVG